MNDKLIITRNDCDYIAEGLARLLEERYISDDARREINLLWDNITDMLYHNDEFSIITVKDKC